MIGPLALIGGDEWTEGCSFDAGLLARSGASTVVVLATAAAYEQPGRLTERARHWFNGPGATVEVLDVYRRPDAMDLELAERLRGAKFITLSSGTSMHLRSVMLGTPVWKALIAAWNGGAVLAASGESAAALSSHCVDSRGGAFTVGLGAIEGLTVVPQFGSWSEDKWHRTVELAGKGLAVAGVDAATALIYADGAWTVEGAGSVTAVRDGKRITIDELPSLE